MPSSSTTRRIFVKSWAMFFCRWFCKARLPPTKELEFGDVLFSLVNVARKEGIDAETALRATCRKFRERWAFMEGAAWGQGKRIEELDMDEMQQLWDQAKMLHVGEASHD